MTKNKAKQFISHDLHIVYAYCTCVLRCEKGDHVTIVIFTVLTQVSLHDFGHFIEFHAKSACNTSFKNQCRKNNGPSGLQSIASRVITSFSAIRTYFCICLICCVSA